MKRTLQKLTHNSFVIWMRHKRTALLISLCNALLLSLLTYILNNQPLFTGEDLNHFAWMELLKERLGLEDITRKDDVLFVNVAYDKQLIELSDEYGMPIGNTDITDRKKLLCFLQMLDSTKQYSYAFLDVRFEKGHEMPEVDSLLFSTISKMKNVVVASHSDVETAIGLPIDRTAVSDYDATIVTTNFVRYRFSYGNKPSMALQAYQDLKGNEIKRHGCLFYTCDGRLCYNSLFVSFPIEDFNEFNDDNSKTYYNLGSDLINSYSYDDIGTLTKGKYVVIGDMIEDMHDTYSGPKPGSVITFYAFRALMEGKHFVNMWLVLLMAIVYFAISISQFSHHSIIERIPIIGKSKSKILHFVVSLIGYTLLLSIIVIILNLIWGITTSILLPSAYFAIQKNIINYKRTEI